MLERFKVALGDGASVHVVRRHDEDGVVNPVPSAVLMSRRHCTSQMEVINDDRAPHCKARVKRLEGISDSVVRISIDPHESQSRRGRWQGSASRAKYRRQRNVEEPRQEVDLVVKEPIALKVALHRLLRYGVALLPVVTLFLVLAFRCPAGRWNASKRVRHVDSPVRDSPCGKSGAHEDSGPPAEDTALNQVPRHPARQDPVHQELHMSQGRPRQGRVAVCRALVCHTREAIPAVARAPWCLAGHTPSVLARHARNILCYDAPEIPGEV
mmetsp:Transcript_16166/g.47473  ORF Transcript_16166/g.47473 Transcript_16166/m.47473 type:complete len:269 (-) Transcript_16166:639-1445(-)